MSDRYLQTKIQYANTHLDYSSPITLLISGLIVSGELIGANTYWTLASTLGEADQSPQELENIESFFLSVADPDQFIHLRNARIIHPSGHLLPNTHGLLWRGQVASIDGFFFELFSPTN